MSWNVVLCRWRWRQGINPSLWRALEELLLVLRSLLAVLVQRIHRGIRRAEWVEHKLAQPLWLGVAVQAVHCVGWRLQRCRFVLALGSFSF